ncbi:microtubule organization protein AKNA isoform X1 [Oryzias melastigma]|uniref:microtubule organization protein AKNA isoform X1 n=1 Tax=Oryzias melastigma TaxID=30732 RepID=UPI000CF82D73|nr:microtubule organization protein AKNA isoform X1 [Oryzias melastigma]XP_024155592.1 microtubule organization protein AKNA isoform X1 [Oryzias melastigma]
MERRAKTIAGVSFWTPAPLRASPSSTEDSEDGWEEEEDGEQAQREKDFVRLMDVNGIIGLPESVGEMLSPADPKPAEEDLQPTHGDLASLTEEREQRRSREEQRKSREEHPLSGVSQSSTIDYLWDQLLHSSAVPEIAAEPFPESSGSDSSLKSDSAGASPRPATPSSEHTSCRSSSGVGELQTSSPCKPRTHCPNNKLSKTSRAFNQFKTDSGSKQQNPKEPAAEPRKGAQNYPSPDLSKVEPRVCFPKGVYKPPRSRKAWRTSASPEPPLMFKSPAEIVKEVLLNSPAGPWTPQEGNISGTVTSTVPPEFRCRRQASALLEQLQEEHDRLLTRYAEAENTIDRLRLEAKVNLYADPPKAGRVPPSGPNHAPFKPLNLDFSGAQIISPSRCCSQQEGSDGRPLSRKGEPQQLADSLFSQTEKFLQQLQTFENLLKREKLKPAEKTKGLCQLAEGLDSLESGYLLALDEHKRLQRSGGEISPLDPDRELEGLIFRCELHLEELREQVEHSLASEREETPTPQSPPYVSAVHRAKAAMEVGGSARKLSEAKEGVGEETLRFPYLRPWIDEHRSTIQDFPMDRHRGRPEVDPLSAAFRTDLQRGDVEAEQRADRDDSQRPTSDQQDHDSGSGKRFSPRSRLPACSQTSRLPVPLGNLIRRLESQSSSLSSLADAEPPGNRSVKAGGTRRVTAQDGVVSPETDSGFVGSESGRLAPAAAPCSVHQRATESRISALLEEKPAAIHVPSSPFSRVVPKPRGDPLEKRTRSGQRRRTCSQQNRVSEVEPSRAGSGSSDSAASESEVEQSNTGTLNSLHTPRSGSSSTTLRHHGDSLRARSSSQAADAAIQTLQAEVSRLKDRVEICMRNQRPPRSDGAAPHTHHCSQTSASTPHSRSTETWSHVRQTEDEGEDEQRPKTQEKSTSAQRKRPQHNFSPSSDGQFPPPPQSSSQTSAASGRCRTAAVHSKTTQTWQRPVCDRTDDGSDQHHLCLRCLSSLRGRSETFTGVSSPIGPLGGDREQRWPSCLHLCGPRDGLRQRDYHRGEEVPSPVRSRAEDSPDGAASSSADPVRLHRCRPVHPPQLLLYSSPVFLLPTSIPDEPRGAQGSDDRKGRSRRCWEADRRLDSSLSRAIRAARVMKITSRHMAHALAAGLQHQQLLAQSCSY